MNKENILEIINKRIETEKGTKAFYETNIRDIAIKMRKQKGELETNQLQLDEVLKNLKDLEELKDKIEKEKYE